MVVNIKTDHHVIFLTAWDDEGVGVDGIILVILMSLQMEAAARVVQLGVPA